MKEKNKDKQHRTFLEHAAPFVAVGVALLLFPTIATLARNAAYHDAADFRNGNGVKYATLHFKTLPRDLDAEFLRKNASEGVILAEQTPDAVYVFLEVVDKKLKPHTYIPGGHIYVIPRPDIDYMTVRVTEVQ